MRQWRRRESNPLLLVASEVLCRQSFAPLDVAADAGFAGVGRYGTTPVENGFGAAEATTSSGECGRVESNHHSARRRVYSPLGSPMPGIRKGVTDRIRTGTAGLTTPGACRYTTVTVNLAAPPATYTRPRCRLTRLARRRRG